jgi:tetratricopeptide (TPR) repeat protein
LSSNINKLYSLYKELTEEQRKNINHTIQDSSVQFTTLYNSVINHFEKLEDKLKNNSEYYYYMGILYSVSHNDSMTIKNFSKAHKINPDDFEIARNYFYSLKNTGREYKDQLTEYLKKYSASLLPKEENELKNL